MMNVTNEYAALAFWMCTTIFGVMGFVLSIGGLLLPWEGSMVGITTGGATWAVYGCVIILAGLFVLLTPRYLDASPTLMAAGSLLLMFSIIYSFHNASGWVSYGVYVSLIGAIIAGIGAVFSTLYLKFREMRS